MAAQRYSPHTFPEESIFGQLKAMVERGSHKFQLVNTAVMGHGLRQTRLLMKQQIQKYRPAALIYIVDAISQSLVTGDHSEMSRLRYDQNGRPQLAADRDPGEPKYTNVVEIATNWLSSKSHLIVLITKLFLQALNLVKQSFPDEIVEIQMRNSPSWPRITLEFRNFFICPN